MKILKKKNKERQGGSDKRFQSVSYDPKFLPASKKIGKTAIDERFSNLFTDKRFKTVSEKDKYGRETEIPDKNDDMERLYYLEQEEKPSNSKKLAKIGKKKLEKPKKAEKDEDQPVKKAKKPSKNQESIEQKYYNSKGEFEWNEASSSDHDSEPSIPEDADVWDSGDEKVPRNESSSSNLALLNYDWTHISAEDLMVLFNSLKPKTGTIIKVTVYPSEFGRKQMEIEEKEGPKGVWEEGEGEAIDNVEEKPKNKVKHKKVEKEVNKWIAKVNKPTEFDPLKLRKYEKDRLKYYYAIIECDSAETAEQIYNESDGTEFELSGMKLDLRFVPEGQEFPYEPKEVCDYLPAVSKVNNFFNRALNHTNVELTWENPDSNRFDFLYNKNLKDEDWDKIDYSKILGEAEVSEEERSDQGVGDKEKGEGIEDDWRADFDKKNRRRVEDMEIRFSSGFTDLGNKILEKKKEKEESTWEKYLKKRKEKKKMKKLIEKKKMKEEDYFVEPEENEEKDEEKYKDELELLVEEKKKGKRSEFDADVKDERFRAIYEDSRFSINPTHKDFKVEGSGKYLKEVVDRRKAKNNRK